MSDDLDRLATTLSRCSVVDLSPVITSHMPGWKDHPDVLVIREARSHDRHGYYCQTLLMPEHTGSHVDAPAHVRPDMMHLTIDTYPADYLMRPGRKVSAAGLNLDAGEMLTLAQFRELCEQQDVVIRNDDVLLVEFGWDDQNGVSAGSSDPQWWGKNQPGFAEDLCAWIAETGVRAVGTDTAACDIAVRDSEILAAHGHATYFLPNNILIIEGLRNLALVPSSFHFIALPLRIEAASGSPLRAIAVIPAN